MPDFYQAYDGLECKQQRCLVHLIRDLNDDLFKNQFDLEYKEFVQNFGILMKSIILTIDRFGLKRHFLLRYKKDVAAFYKPQYGSSRMEQAFVIVPARRWEPFPRQST